MEIRLLKDDYLRSERIYIDFMNDQINKNEDNFSGETVFIDEAPDFPVYLNINNNEKRLGEYLEALEIMTRHYLLTPRDVHFNGAFWYSLLCTEKRDYLIQKYPQITKSEEAFRNIVLKKFDWENYIYKCILGAQYISDNVKLENERNRYYELIVNNLDVYNYIIKYAIFRNDKFLINVLDIISENNLSEILKANIKDRDDLGADERYGRRVVFEMNKSYPVVMVPTLNKEELENIFLENLGKYYTGDVLEAGL